ncbi:dispanin subfamily A member 2b-like [Lacerta agilis]|uniref:dispanin subfamily A member 2b-like n=1 Tax=Lacerta agilis TaxID=80427 RepID=UPI00141A0BF3|nr:dispanin subfamily A member 2b-like [Lacerta agilis]
MQPVSSPVALRVAPYDPYRPRTPPPANPYPYPVGCVVVQPPQDFVIWSVFSLAVMNHFCLGFAALIFSIKSRDCKVMGDPEGAALHGRKAKYLNIVALIVGIIFFISMVVVVASDPPPFHRAVKAILQRYQ